MASLTVPPEAQAREDAVRIPRQLHALFEWAVGVQDSDIPAAAWRRAAEILLDDISAMTAAWNEPEFQRLYPRLIAQSHGTGSSVFCRPGTKADPRTAALVNAVAANWLELDEGYRGTPCHAGLYTLPALLAAAEADDVSLRKLLRCLVVSYELITRIARAFPQRTTLMQSHGRYAALGAACAIGLIRGFDATRLADAASAAATLITPSPRNHLAGGALVRNVWAGVGARNGMDAADWSDAGITGMSTSIYDVYATVLGGLCRPDALTADLGSDWAVTQGYTKMYACCQHLHAAVEAVLDTRAEILDRGVESVAAIHVETHELALPLDEANPRTSLAAKFSMSHAMAAALVTGKASEEAFSSRIIGDADIHGLRQHVSMAPWPEDVPPPPNDRPARVHVRFKDGTVIVGECLSARGGADRPFPRADLFAKIGRLAGSSYPGIGAVARSLADATSIDSSATWRQVLATMRGPSGDHPA